MFISLTQKMEHLPVYYTGPMWSSKSSHLVMQMLTFKNGAEVEAVLFTPERDSRSGVGLARSHDGLEMSSIPCSHPNEILEKLPQNCKVVGIEEAHMWVDTSLHSTKEICDIWNMVLDELEQRCKRIFIAGLDKSYHGVFFASHLALAARCIVKGQHSWCRTGDCRNPAMYTILIKKVETTDDIIVGGKDLYQPACRKHFIANQKQATQS
jgi:thymidine kinase